MNGPEPDVTCTTCGDALEPIPDVGWVCTKGHEQATPELNAQAEPQQAPATVPGYAFQLSGHPDFVIVNAPGVPMDVVVGMLEKAIVVAKRYQERVAYSKRMAASARLN